MVDVAARVFAERGFHATSIDDLVEATGLQRGGLYHYMDGKKDLLIRIHERFINPLLAEAERIVAVGEPPDVTLERLAGALMGDIAMFNNQVTVFLHEWRVIENDPEWVEVRRSRKRFEALVEGVLVAGQKQGMFSFKSSKIALLAFRTTNYSYQWYSGRTARLLRAISRPSSAASSSTAYARTSRPPLAGPVLSLGLLLLTAYRLVGLMRCDGGQSDVYARTSR